MATVEIEKLSEEQIAKKEIRSAVIKHYNFS